MLYILADWFTPHLSVLNVLSYNTVRAGGAAFTAFLLCLIFGPRLIERLRELKIGQYIKKDHVADLHALHKGKAGTPTMGGSMIILASTASLLLWGTPTNRLLVAAVVVMLLLGFVGFLDDYSKLRKKHNDGLSARAKMAGQVVVGLLLGLFLYFSPITVSSSNLSPHHVLDWFSLVKTLKAQSEPANELTASPAVKRVWANLSDNMRKDISTNQLQTLLESRNKRRLVDSLNLAINRKSLYDPSVWPVEQLPEDVRDLATKAVQKAPLEKAESQRLNREVVQMTFPKAIAKNVRNLHTKVEIPGFKGFLLPLGPLYILFIIFIMVSMSNAVNLTDGLDGLAAGASVIALLAFTGIAYVVSRVDWSEYLYLIYVPEASELTVFSAALMGATLGFLWFNAHPAEVFMGDTGSLALGGSIATMAILTKQELLLPIVAGLFVLEIGSVVIQVASFKTTGKRVFRMSPLHHHFELKGWSETKVTIRFWIIAFLFALMSLGALKLR